MTAVKCKLSKGEHKYSTIPNLGDGTANLLPIIQMALMDDMSVLTEVKTKSMYSAMNYMLWYSISTTDTVHSISGACPPFGVLPPAVAHLMTIYLLIGCVELTYCVAPISRDGRQWALYVSSHRSPFHFHVFSSAVI